MENNREMVTKLVKGELTYREAYELDKKLHSRSDLEIINDLKELSLENLINTRDCIEDGIRNNPELNTEETRKSLGYLKIAIKEKTEYKNIKKYLLENETTFEQVSKDSYPPYIEIEKNEHLIFTDGFLFPVKFDDKGNKYIFNSDRFFQLSDDRFEKLNENDIYYYALDFIENQVYDLYN
ncbi:hypothetical protein [Clostridium saccharoperbutylacetonicum]|uniref:hypothetical protein n=1 Tax=Clostridium saccharoperbutylacetonicum TaxID=36745 RepID=UPI0039E74724